MSDSDSDNWSEQDNDQDRWEVPEVDEKKLEAKIEEEATSPKKEEKVYANPFGDFEAADDYGNRGNKNVKEKLLKDHESSDTSPSKSNLNQIQNQATLASGPGVGVKKGGVKNALNDFQVKHMDDINKLVNDFIRSKLFPDPEISPNRVKKLTAKNAPYKILKQAVEKKYSFLEQKEMEKFDRELQKIIDGRKKLEVLKEAQQKKEIAKQEEAERIKREEELKREAEAKGETFINDEDFFAGFE